MQVVLGSNLGLAIILCPPLIIISACDRVCNRFPKLIPIESSFFTHRRCSWPTCTHGPTCAPKPLCLCAAHTLPLHSHSPWSFHTPHRPTPHTLHPHP